MRTILALVLAGVSIGAYGAAAVVTYNNRKKAELLRDALKHDVIDVVFVKHSTVVVHASDTNDTMTVGVAW
jgi:hypothetical protein